MRPLSISLLTFTRLAALPPAHSWLRHFLAHRKSYCKTKNSCIPSNLKCEHPALQAHPEFCNVYDCWYFLLFRIFITFFSTHRKMRKIEVAFWYTVHPPTDHAHDSRLRRSLVQAYPNQYYVYSKFIHIKIKKSYLPIRDISRTFSIF